MLSLKDSMYKIFWSVFGCLVSIASAIAQDPAAIDSVKILNEVVIQAYGYKRPAEEVPAAVAVVSQKDFERFNNSTLLPTANTIPGVRMEERSPGSYRFSIRGSLLRSPFGVRNVKVYWNGLPFTDGGGNTYLNLLDFSSIGSMEIIKGPGGSLYGAGTGGVILLQTPVYQGKQTTTFNHCWELWTSDATCCPAKPIQKTPMCVFNIRVKVRMDIVTKRLCVATECTGI